MFSSIHSQRWLKWLFQKKNYIVNLEIKIFDKYTFIDVEVESHTKESAKKIAIEITKKNFKIIPKGLKSLGRKKNIKEF